MPGKNCEAHPHRGLAAANIRTCQQSHLICIKNTALVYAVPRGHRGCLILHIVYPHFAWQVIENMTIIFKQCFTRWDYVLCCHKSSSKRGKVVTMETSFVWKACAMRRVCSCAQRCGESERHCEWKEHAAWLWLTLGPSGDNRGQRWQRVNVYGVWCCDGW